MSSFSSYCAVYREIDEENEANWVIYDGYKSFESVYEDVITRKQFKGFLVDWGWFIYGVTKDGLKIKLDHTGNPTTNVTS
jgi:hypothetical protein